MEIGTKTELRREELHARIRRVEYSVRFVFRHSIPLPSPIRFSWISVLSKFSAPTIAFLAF